MATMTTARPSHTSQLMIQHCYKIRATRAHCSFESAPSLYTFFIVPGRYLIVERVSPTNASGALRSLRRCDRGLEVGPAERLSGRVPRVSRLLRPAVEHPRT